MIIISAKFQPSGFKTVGGDRDGRQKDGRTYMGFHAILARAVMKLLSRDKSKCMLVDLKRELLLSALLP